MAKKPWQFEQKHFVAAALLASGKNAKEASEIGRADGYDFSERTVFNWQRQPEFAELVTTLRREITAKVRARLVESSVGTKEGRIAYLDMMAERLGILIAERGLALDGITPGGASGVVFIDETGQAKLDRALFAELKGIVQEAAEQTGERGGDEDGGKRSLRIVLE